MRKIIVPGDIGVALVYVALFSVFLVLSVQNLGDAGSLLIQSSGVEYRYDLNAPRILVFEGPVGTSTIEIDDNHRARFIQSDCRDQICVNSGYLERGGSWAACLPNRVIATMNKKSTVDDSTLNIDAGAY